MLCQNRQIVEITVSIHTSLIVLYSPNFTSHLTSMWLFKCLQCHETIQWDQVQIKMNVFESSVRPSQY